MCAAPWGVCGRRLTNRRPHEKARNEVERLMACPQSPPCKVAQIWSNRRLCAKFCANNGLWRQLVQGSAAACSTIRCTVRSGRQCKLKNGASRRVGGRPQAPAVLLDDRTADRQAQTKSVWLGGVESLEEVFLDAGR